MDLSLKATIEIIENDIKEKKTFDIKDPVLLLSTLRDLDNMIGLNKVKDSIAAQLRHLLNKSKTNQKSGTFLNMVLSGPPGVGKTELAVIYAKIMFSLGYLDGQTSEGVDRTSMSMEEMQLYLAVFYLISYFIMVLIKLLSGINLIILCMFVVLLVALMYTMKLKKSKENNLSDLVTVVNGGQLKGQYVGWTTKNVQDLLKANLGKKVVFIDEAYTIMTDQRDVFGMEALTTLNQFMSENPKNCIVVFAGYRDLLDNTIFKFQPGLESRITWDFECEPYSPEELTRIYLQQLNKENLVVSDIDNCLQQIKKHYNLFESQGRSTARLVYFTKLEIENFNFINRTPENCVVSSEILEKSIQKLHDNKNRKKNNVTNDEVLKKLREFIDT